MMSTVEREAVCRRLAAWYATPRGDYALTAIRRALGPILDLSFGYHLLQVGLVPERSLFCDSPINHRILLAPTPYGGAGLLGDVEELPLASDSVDTLIAHHALEFAAHPHQALREMQRVLAPHGHLLVIGFNPFSLQGIANRTLGRFGHGLWHYDRLLGKSRLTDWLHLLGCEVEAVHNLYAIPPAGSGRLRRTLTGLDQFARDHNWPLGGIYVLHAIKQVRGRNRPRAALQVQRRRLIGLVPKPTAAPVPATPSSRRDGHAA
jgi:SAM-dependent methyltransferase